MREENYYTVQGWMVSNLKLKGNALSVFAIIYGFSQDGESSFTGSVNYLCKWLACSRPTVSKALDELVQKEYIIKTQEIRNKVLFNTYKVNLQVVKKLYGGSKETLQGVVKNLSGGSKETLPNNKDYNKSSDNKEDNNNADARQSIDTEFNKLWELYPKKQGKANALKAYQKARKGHPEIYEQVEQGINGYVAYLKANKVEPQYIAQGSTWFGQQRWMDDFSIGGVRGASTKQHNEEAESKWGSLGITL